TTTQSRILKPKQISATLNNYINDMVRFQSSIKGDLMITDAMIQKKTMYLAVPEKTTPVQWAEINKSISYAAEKKYTSK
ncbi:hypothetical protein, partial [Xenorhabdus koppenhoeferi]|uniref:endonuclease toxin domain-containing protein n=1 Tax=Xenorhabdus koppenhoeferi TaxID=351659 RepID=UPI002B4033C8